VIETGRLLPRPLRRDDVDVFADVSADPDVTRHIGHGHRAGHRMCSVEA
jgi:hypothetical protein